MENSDIALALSIVAMVVAALSVLVPLAIEWHRNKHKIVLSVAEVVRYVSKDGLPLLFLNISLCNRAYIPKILLKVEIFAPYGHKFDYADPVHDLENKICSFQLHGGLLRTQASDLGTFPLDVDPLRTRSFLIPVKLLALPEQYHESVHTRKQLKVYAIAYDEMGKAVARYDFEVDNPDYNRAK